MSSQSLTINITILAFPSTNKGVQKASEGTISGLEKGIVKTDAIISSGASGGAGLDASSNLVGIATRILLREIGGVEEVVDYERSTFERYSHGLILTEKTRTTNTSRTRILIVTTDRRNISR